tara:strand:+ start:397 stop:546 length:150 start_codon:yes stop_codon:yes gene_type:complete
VEAEDDDGDAEAEADAEDVLSAAAESKSIFAFHTRVELATLEAMKMPPQ